MKRGLLSCLMLFLLTCGSDRGTSKDKTDVILVLDTSYSMAGSGGRDIISDVRQSINRYIDTLKDGDRLTLATFDTDVKFYDTMLINNANDRETAKNFITTIPATGLWTHTHRMLEKLFAKAEELQTDGGGRELSLVVMTDGLDDPPPTVKTDRMNIKDIATKYEGRDWWIYLINYQELKDKAAPKQQTAQKQAVKEQELAQRQELESSLRQVSEKAVIVDVDPAKQSDPNKVVEIIDTAKADFKKKIPIEYIIAPLLLLLPLLILFLILKRRASQLKVKGSLEYWNHDMIRPNVEGFDMTRYGFKEIQVGSKMGNQLRIPELDVKMPFKIVAVRHNKEIKADIVSGAPSLITFVNGEHGKYLENGEVFRAGNYSFRYME